MCYVALALMRLVPRLMAHLSPHGSHPSYRTPGELGPHTRARRRPDHEHAAYKTELGWHTCRSTARSDSESELLDADRQHGGPCPAPWAKDSSRRQEEDQVTHTAQAFDAATRPHLRSMPRLMLCVRLDGCLWRLSVCNGLRDEAIGLRCGLRGLQWRQVDGGERKRAEGRSVRRCGERRKGTELLSAFSPNASQHSPEGRRRRAERVLVV